MSSDDGGSKDESPAARAARPEEGSAPAIDLGAAFFDSPPLEFEPPFDEEDARDPKLLLKLSPVAARRRAQLAKYVAMAVALASAVCLAALVKFAVARAPSDAEPVRFTTHPTASAVTVNVAPSATEAPATSAVEPPTEPPTAAVASGEEPAPEPDPKLAAEEKNASRTALERGKMAGAIEAGERSVALDPSDAEAWLILGAAYLQKGDPKDARRCFKSCLEKGKRGNRSECLAMLR